MADSDVDLACRPISSQALRVAFEESPVGVVVCDTEGVVREINATAGEMLGIEPHAMSGHSVLELIHPDDASGIGPALETAVAGVAQDRVVRFSRVDGTARWAQVRWRLAPAQADEQEIVVQLVDLTDAVRGSLAEVEQRLAVAFDNAPIGMALVALDGRFLQANRSMCALVGYSQADLQRLSFVDITHPDDVAQARAEYRQLLDGRIAETRAEKRYVTAAGETKWVRRVGSVIRSAAGEPLYFIVQVEDTSEERAVRDELARLAYSDALTGLGNRAALIVRAEQMLAVAPVTLLLFDLDDFKKVNDSLGHHAGDDVLTTFAARLSSILPAREMAVRLGGDEFVVMVRETDADALLAFSKRVLDAASEAFEVADTTVTLSASIGIATGGHGDRVGEVLRRADMALYAAKRAGKSRAVIFRPDLQFDPVEDLVLEAALRQAVAEHAISVDYQPIFRLDDGRLTGVEALCRWTDPVRGPVSPNTFIPVAERSDIIHDLGELVLRRACTDVAELARRTGRPVGVAVNVSVRQLGRPGFAALVGEVLASSGLPVKDLTLEITETALVEPGPSYDAMMAELRRLGVLLALDDFGTGYSSLGRLRASPFNVLKIDKSFLAEITGRDAQAALAAAGIALGHALGAAVVAEGIETPTQLDRMRELNCDYGQGYLLGRPQPLSAVEALLVNATASASAGPMGRRSPGPADETVGKTENSGKVVDLIRHLLDLLQRATGLESTYLTQIIWPDNRQRVTVVHHTGLLNIPEGLNVAWEDTLCRLAMLRGTPTLSDARHEASSIPGAHQIGRHISIPIRLNDGSTYGTLCGASTTAGTIDQSTRNEFERFAEIIAGCLTPDALPVT